VGLEIGSGETGAGDSVKRKIAQHAFSQFRYRLEGRCVPVRPPLSRHYQSLVNALHRMGIFVYQSSK